MQEQDLIARIRARDPRAFKELFDANVSLVYNVCFRMLNNRHDAEDVTQDVFFEAYRSLGRFRFESKLSTWLYRIAVNRSLNQRRRKKLEQWSSPDFERDDETDAGGSLPAATDDGPDAALEKRDTERFVQQAINSLPDQQRTALVLSRYEELSHVEIAAIMDVTVASVESRLHRAKQALARKLRPLKRELE
jgi:RNA polymerase sigma-70 factor (ECF subfamily)